MKKLGFLYLSVLAFCCTIDANSSVPQLINYQGKLYQASGAPVPDGNYRLVLSIYEAPTGGNAIWTETQNPIAVKGSAFHTLLGSVNPIGPSIFDHPERYLGIKLGDDPELAPRQRIASVPYAMAAATVPDASITPGKLSADAQIPVGVIVMWSGAVDAIPSGWALCDGTKGTPNLRDRFIVGAGGEYAVGVTGGSKSHQLSITEMPSHNHEMETPEGIWYFGAYHMNVSAGGYDGNWAFRESNPVTRFTGGGQPHENRPPYYALCFIMKVGG